MLFNSLQYLIFFPIVFCVYWILLKKNLQFQNAFLLILSYYFYSCWDWRFLFLLVFSTLLDFYSAIKIKESNNNKNKTAWFWISIGINLGFLSVFKYYDFFISSFAASLTQLGVHFNPSLLNLVLPVGISFYTFHGLSYVIDVYKERIEPERNYIDYGLFVSFFPLLVAGPIERATHLLPQIKQQRVFKRNQIVNGLKQVVWGMFKKIVIADNCAVFANQIFDNYTNYNGSTLVLGAIFFTFQIYGDFSGYSDIALGSARMLGINLLRNFAFPYFSRDIAEFWRRWHISLSSWFRDYVYVPLGGSRVKKSVAIRNTFIIFIISGLWHGANWTFIFWGLLNALYFLPLQLLNNNRKNIEIVAMGKMFPTINEIINMFITFCLVVFAWIFFRANDISAAFEFVSGIFNKSLLKTPHFLQMGKGGVTLLLVTFLIFIEWIGRENQFGIESIGLKWKRVYRWMFFSFVIFLIGFFMQTTESPFIYFQF